MRSRRSCRRCCRPRAASASTWATSPRVTEPRSSLPTCTCPVGTSSVRRPGPHDGPVEVARAEVVVGGLLGAQVDLEDVVGVGVGVLGAHRRDHHVAAYSGGLGGVGEHDRGALVDGLLARRVAVRSATRGEHDRVRAAHHVGHLLDAGVLQVEHRRVRRRRPEVGDVLGVADHPDDVVARLGDQPPELAGDLSVASCDDDAHGLDRSEGGKACARCAPTLTCAPCPSPWSPTRPRPCPPRRSRSAGSRSCRCRWSSARRRTTRASTPATAAFTPQMLADALKEWTPVSTSRPNPEAILEVYERLAADGCRRDRLGAHLRGAERHLRVGPAGGPARARSR